MDQFQVEKFSIILHYLQADIIFIIQLQKTKQEEKASHQI